MLLTDQPVTHGKRPLPLFDVTVLLPFDAHLALTLSDPGRFV